MQDSLVIVWLLLTAVGKTCPTVTWLTQSVTDNISTGIGGKVDITGNKVCLLKTSSNHKG